MPIDFSKLGGSDASETITEPRDLFNVLPGKRKGSYSYPRDVQAEVWAQWYARRSESDLTIKMNTGSGKTVVGLVLLKSCLNEGAGPAIYVAPSPPLVKQVLAEAQALGIETTEDPSSARYLSGKAILIVNIHKLINGMSVFGVGDEGVKIPIGSVVIDDAHACLVASEEQFSIRLPASNPAYKALLNAFYPDLESQSPSCALEIKDGDPDQNMVVPYWSWIDKQGKVLSALHAERKSDALKFNYPLLKDQLSLCNCVFGGGEVEITSRCLPIDRIPSFTSASRRIFMGATFGDDSILVTHFDAKPDSVQKPIVPTSSGDIGDRMILVPQELNPAITDPELKNYFKSRSKAVNVVVLVPSYRRAEFWSDVADAILRHETLMDGIAKLRAGHVGLVVLVNKYDGIDLPEDACRILVLDNLPDVRGRFDKFEQVLLQGSEQAIRDSMQRVEQGMGRGVRSNDDHCLVFLMGRSLTGQLYVRNAKKFFTPATRAQFDLSEKLAKLLQNPTLRQIHDVVVSFLQRDEGWVRPSKAAVVLAKHEPSTSLPLTALCQRQAFNAASRGDYRQACADIQRAVSEEKVQRIKGWLLWQLAGYEHRTDAARSQHTLKGALALNPQITRPMEGIEYIHMSGKLASQAALCLERLRENYTNQNAFIVDMNTHIDSLVFEPGTATRFENTLAEIAGLLGFTGQQPERDFGRGPDVLWSIGSQLFFVIECKNGAVVDTIDKHNCNQLTGSMTWFESKYGETCSAVPLMIHPAVVPEYAATLRPDTRIMNGERLAALRTALRDFAVALASKPRFGTETEAADTLSFHKLTAERFVAQYTVKPRAKA